MLWIIILIVTLLVTILGIIFMTYEIGKFSFIKSISNNKRYKKILISLGIIILFFIVLSYILSLVNAIVIFIHFVFLFLIFELLFKIISILTKKKYSFDLIGIIVIFFTIVYLSIGFYLCNNVWQTNYKLYTNKDINLRIIMFSDFHLGTTFDSEGLKKYINEVKKQNPDILFITGDFVDDGTLREDMVKACRLIGSIKTKYGIYFSYGNHDEGYYNTRDFTEEDLEREMEKNNITILKDEIKEIDNLSIIGRLDTMYERKPIKNLADSIKDKKSKYIIVLDHEPNDYNNESKEDIDLVLSGHTHGGQLFPITHLGKLLSINDKTYGYEKRNGTSFIVTSGISDWELKFKTGTKSEYVVIDILKK